MSRQRVRRFVPTGGKCGLHFLLAVLGTSWPCGGCCKEERPNLRLCGVWSLPRAKRFSSGCGAGGRKGVRAGRTGMLGGGRARLVRLGPRSLTPDFLLSASAWRCVNFQGT